MLGVGLVYLSGVHLFAGEFEVAEAMIGEAETITAATGNASLAYGALVFAGWQGIESEAQELIDAAVGSATARGEGRVLALTGYVGALLNNGLGRYEAAIDSARARLRGRRPGLRGVLAGRAGRGAVRAAAGPSRPSRPYGGSRNAPRPPAPTGRSGCSPAHRRW